MAGLAASAWAAGSSSRFLRDAMEGNLAEVAVGHLAQQRGMNPGVRRFGDVLVADHGKANAQAMSLARRHRVAVPRTPGLMARAEYRHLARLRGRDFDRAFIDGMVRDHRKDIGMYEREARARDGSVSRFAALTLPTLRKHLAMAEALQRRRR
jgi:putative membrane protein